MHPFKVEQPYPYQQWWIAAYGSEVKRELLGRKILGQSVILYRTENGEPVALSGICPHRSFPLELSKLVGDNVQCGYHGFTFDKKGACVLVPSQSGAPTNSSLREFPVVERGGLVWIWTGRREAADPTLIPDLEQMGLGTPGWATEEHPLVTIQGRYMLLIDNLLDLSHASFIHVDTIPGGDKVASIPVKLVETHNSLNVSRLGQNLPVNPLHKMQFPDFEGSVDQQFDAECFGPALIRTGGTIFVAGEGKELGTQNFVHGITPADPHNVHYFVITSRNFGLDNPALGHINRDMGTRIQPQDIQAIEAVERVLQSNLQVREVSARVDTGALKARHRIEQQIQAEMA